MSSTSGGCLRHLRIIFYAICILQLLGTTERQIFDFLGYLWLPMLANFLNLVLVIFCLFGIWQRHRGYIMAYAIYAVIYATFNVFLLCFYLEAGGLKRTDDLLSFGTQGFSWWWENGFGCRRNYYVEEELDVSGAMPPKVTGCLVQYQIVESIHAGIHLVLSVLGIILSGIFLWQLHSERKEKQRSNMNKSIYSIEYSPRPHDTNRNGTLSHLESDLYANASDDLARGAVAGHMTPRRVKRRSYTRSSARSVGGGTKSLNRNRRSSTRSIPAGGIRNKGGSSSLAVNPVTRLINHQGGAAGGAGTGARSPDSSTSNEDHVRGEPSSLEPYGQINPAYESSRPNSIYSSSVSGIPNPHGGHHNSRPPSALTSYSNFHGQRKPVEHIGMTAVTNLTQENFTQQTRNQQPGPEHHTGAIPKQQPPVMNSSYDDLPPPPPPIAESPIDPRMGGSQASAQVPVPQQRSNLTRKNEYVNMPVSNNFEEQSSLLSNENDTQTLRAHDHYLQQNAPKNIHPLPPRQPLPLPNQTNGTNGHMIQPRSAGVMRSYRLANGQEDEEDDYGFAGQGQGQAGNSDDKWYLRDSMKPVGSSAHGGNCKCYRCQRKLTAI